MTTITAPLGRTKGVGVALSAILVALLAMGGIVGALSFADSRSESPGSAVPAAATPTTPGLSPAEEVQMLQAASSSSPGQVLSVAEEVQMLKAATDPSPALDSGRPSS